VDLDELAGMAHPVPGVDTAADDDRAVRTKGSDLFDPLELDIDAARPDRSLDDLPDLGSSAVLGGDGDEDLHAVDSPWRGKAYLRTMATRDQPV